MKTPIIAIARGIAIAAHAGQRYGPHKDYFRYHIMGVVGKITGDTDRIGTIDTLTDVVAVALLHDVLEDTKVDASDLSLAGIPARIIVEVKALTRTKGEPYMEYIGAIKRRGGMAFIVKIADISFHLAEPEIKPTLEARYLNALAILTRP